MLVDKNTFQTGQSTDFVQFGPYILIAVGSIILIVGFLGCCGSIRESQCMLATDIGENIYEDYKKSVDNYNDGGYREYVDTVHVVYHCCGYKNGVSDFDSYPNKPPGCTNQDGSQVTQICTPEVFQAKLETVKQHALVVGLSCLGVGVVLLLGMVFSMMLCCAIRDNM